MKPEDLVVTDLHGKIIEGHLRPSSDLATHIVLYKAFPEIGGVSHTHSEYATAWAQARKAILCLGTTHADYFCGAIPVTDIISDSDIAGAYEENTGHAIARLFKNLDPGEIPAVLVANQAAIGEYPLHRRRADPEYANVSTTSMASRFTVITAIHRKPAATAPSTWR
jgi:L-ribulose-5-phosphate 4-epimerase